MLNIILLLLLSTHVGSMLSAHQHNNEQRNESESDIWITVFIHGTLGLKYTLGPYTTLRIAVNSIRDTEYENTVQMLRQNPIFYKNQAMQELGLHRITDSHREFGAWMLSYVYDYMQQEWNPRNSVYYTFGWSGLLSERERRIAGYSLYHQLKEIYDAWKYAGYTPHITILGYSHGGTVAEYVAPYHAEDTTPTFSYIDELILLGTPIQRRTDCYTNWPVFRNTYNIYSRGDFFQKLDIFSTPNAWPHRRFRDDETCKALGNMYQIGIRLTMPPYCNGRYQYYRSGTHRKDFSPGHIEMYFFGWPNSNWMYRQSFPLAPLPAAVLVPAIIAQKEHFPSHNVICEMWPPEERILIRERKTCRWKTHPFPICDTLRKLQQFASRNRPEVNLQLASDYAARQARELVYAVWEDIYDKC